MVSKNNFKHKIQDEAKRVPHYGLRKLSVGVASVLLSTTLFFGVSAHAETTTTSSQLQAEPEAAQENDSQGVANQTANSVTLSGSSSADTNNQAKNDNKVEATVTEKNNAEQDDKVQAAKSSANVSSDEGQKVNDNSTDSVKTTELQIHNLKNASNLTAEVNESKATDTVTQNVIFHYRLSGNKYGTVYESGSEKIFVVKVTGKIGDTVSISESELPAGWELIEGEENTVTITGQSNDADQKKELIHFIYMFNLK